jgi:hypothetical protein
MSGQTSAHWLHFPLDIELTVDANRLGLSVLTIPSVKPPDKLIIGEPGPYPSSQWVMNYSLIVNQSSLGPSTPHDIRLAAIEMVIAAEILDRAAKLLSEAMAVHMGTIAPSAQYSLGGDGIQRLFPTYASYAFVDLADPWFPTLPTFDYLRFELLGAYPGSSKVKVRLLLAATAISGFLGFAANLSTVSDEIEKIGAPWSEHHEADKQHVDNFRTKLLDFQLDRVKHGDVKELQRNLSYLGFFSGAFDGQYGPITRQAIVNFEKAHHLPELDYKDPALHVEIVEAVTKHWQLARKS